MKLKTIFYLLFSGLLIWECASIKAPPGGPVDETPPEIVNINPPNRTVNLTDRRIIIEFSEYMDENSFKNNIVVFPRLEELIKYKFKGDEIHLILPDELDSAKTYIIQLNRNIKDEHGVSLAKPIQLAYSSGDRISSGMINGNVFGSGEAVVHLWKINDLPLDSIFATIPDYVTDVDDNGFYSFEYLAADNYIVLAVDRTSADLPLNVERSEYGMFWQDNITLSENDTIFNINIRMHKEAQELKLVRGEWSNYSWGYLYFNNDLPDSINLSMRLTQDKAIVDYDYFINSFDKTNLMIFPEDSLLSEPLQIMIDSIMFENQLQLDSAAIEIRIPQVSDTSYLKIIKPQSRLSITPNSIEGDQIDLLFSKPVKLSANELLAPKLFDSDSIESDILITRIDSMYCTISPVSAWQENSKYRLVLNRDGVTTEYGRGLQDSLITINISTTSRMGYGGVIGNLQTHKRDGILVELFSVKNPSLSRIADVNSKLQFEFKMIPEGDYSLRIFNDRNGDMNYNFGTAYPLHPSEWFYFYPDTFEVRANWDTELNPILLPEVK